MRKDIPKNDGEQNAKAMVKHMKSLAKNPPSKIEQLRFQAANALSELRYRAKTDTEALEVLATELQFHVRGMNQDALSNLKHYQKLTRKCATWPGCITADKDIQQKQEWLVKMLELGTDTPLNYSGRQWSRRTAEIRAALYLIDCLQRQHGNLPPLSRATALEWWKASQDLFYSIHGKDFERHPNFSSYWKLPFEKQGEASNSQRTWIRKTIKDKMRQAFVSIARKSKA